MSKCGALIFAFVVFCSLLHEGSSLKIFSASVLTTYFFFHNDLTKFSNNICCCCCSISNPKGQSVRCFQCNSLFSNGCGESINTFNHIVQSVIDCNPYQNPYIGSRPQCRKITYRLPAGGWGYIRGCHQNDSPEYGLLDPEVYLCDTDACNSASLMGPIWVMTAVTTVAVILSRVV